jgi:hypothetical protein
VVEALPEHEGGVGRVRQDEPTRLPVSRRRPTVAMPVVVVTLVDQAGDLAVWPSWRTRLPSGDTESSEDDGSETGAFRLATHTVVCFGIWLYQMPMYHFCDEVSVAAREKRMVMSTR